MTDTPYSDELDEIIANLLWKDVSKARLVEHLPKAKLAKQRLSRLLIDAKKQENKQWQKLVLDRQELHSSTPYINVLEYEQRIEEIEQQRKELE